jgi:formyl-CoA transferase
MGQRGVGADERYATHGARGAILGELDDVVASWTWALDADDLLERLHDGGVPAGRIFRAKDMLSDPHFAAREAIVNVAHPEFDQLPMQNVVPRLSATPGRVRGVGPDLGEHTDEVLTDLLGMSPDELRALHDAGVV